MIPHEMQEQIQRLIRAQAATEEHMAKFFVAQTKTEERLQQFINTVDRGAVAFARVLRNHEDRLGALERNQD